MCISENNFTTIITNKGNLYKRQLVLIFLIPLFESSFEVTVFYRIQFL